MSLYRTGLAVLVAGFLACEQTEVSTERGERNQTAAPLDDLPAGDQAAFRKGFEDFIEAESIETGLGPLFNATSCSDCHNAGAPGGSGNFRVLRAMCRTGGQAREPSGGSLVHLSSTRPDLFASSIAADCDAIVALRKTTTVLGAGLIEAVADEDILEEARRQPRAIAGRAAMVTDPGTSGPRVGKLGWKAQHATLDAFAGDAYLNELGITNELFPDEVAPNGDTDLLAEMDTVADPEAHEGSVASLAAFMRLSAPLPQRAHDEGLAVFRAIGCDGCHREQYVTRSERPSLTNRVVRLYSDLLLHDVGTGDGIPQGAATGEEFRTPPLWGLAHASVFLHDGRAPSVGAAIAAHDAQARTSREAFFALDSARQRSLVDFLKGL